MTPDNNPLPSPIIKVDVRQIHGDGSPPADATINIVDEAEIKIDEQGRPLRILMATPRDVKALVV